MPIDQLPDASIPELPGPYTDPKSGDLLAIYDTQGGVTKKIDIALLLPASPSSNYKYISTFTYGLDAIVEYAGKWYVSLQADNVGNIPDAAGSLFWEERDKSASGLVPYVPGIFSQDRVSVLNGLDGFTQLFELDAAVPRPFNSIDFYAEFAAGKWVLASETGYIGVSQAAHGFAVNDVITHKAGAWAKATASDDDNLAIVRQVVGAGHFIARLAGSLIKNMVGLVASTKYYRQPDGTIGSAATAFPVFVAISTTEAVLLSSGGGGGSGSGSGIAGDYDDIADLLADQGTQQQGRVYYVEDASADPTVDADWALYRYKGTTAGDLTDYQKLGEKESLDVIFNVLGTTLTGYSASAGTISSGDTILQAFNKIGHFIANITSTINTWWNALKGTAQNITAKWTFTNIAISGQASTGSNRRPLIIDSAGDVTKSSFVNYDETNKTLETTGKDDLNSVNFRAKNLSGNPLFDILNDFTARFFGTSAFWFVPSDILAGNAGLETRDIDGIQWRERDSSSNDFRTLEKIANTHVDTNLRGKRIQRFKRPTIFDVGGIAPEVNEQIPGVATTTTANTQNVILSLAIPTDHALVLNFQNVFAYATNGNVVGMKDLQLTFKNVAGTVTGGVTTVTNDPVPNTVTAIFNININGTSVELRLNNDTGTGRQYYVFGGYSYILTQLPS